jgi:hypothetical protein
LNDYKKDEKIKLEPIYKYNLSEKDVKYIYNELLKKKSEYIESCNKFLEIDKFIKTLNPYLNTIQNNNFDIDLNIIQPILMELNMIDQLYCYKYIPMSEIDRNPDVIFEKSKLDINYLKENKNYLIQSDINTGKNKTFLKYIENGELFISIAFKKYFSYKQYEKFNIYLEKFGHYCNHQHCLPVENGQSWIVCIDDLFECGELEYKNYILFLDEFSSIINYLIISDLGNEFMGVFLVFIKLIKNAKQIICFDTNVNENCFKLLDFCNIKYSYELNTYSHTKDVKVTEYYNQDLLINKIKKLDKFLVCFNNKMEAKYLYEILADYNIKLYDENEGEYLDFNKYDKIIYTTNINYKKNNKVKRPLFCFYNLSKVLPNYMFQQINKHKNIEYINYIILNRNTQIKNPNYNEYRLILEEINTINEPKDFYYFDYIEINITKINFDSLSRVSNKENGNILNLYENLLKNIIYNIDCYESNKIVHFNLLMNKNYKLDEFLNHIYFKKDKIKKNINHIKKGVLMGFDINSDYVKKLNNILKVPDNDIDEFKEWFINTRKITNHFNLCQI